MATILTIHYEPKSEDHTLQQRASLAILAAFEGESSTVTEPDLMREIERQNNANHRLCVYYPDPNGFTVTSQGRFFSPELTAVINAQ